MLFKANKGTRVAPKLGSHVLPLDIQCGNIVYRGPEFGEQPILLHREYTGSISNSRKRLHKGRSLNFLVLALVWRVNKDGEA